ncbi:hypothetical protein V1264_019901 [Littorina saxatilis]
MTSSLEPSNSEKPLDSTLQTSQIFTATQPLSTENLHMSSYYIDVNISSQLADVSYSTVDSAVTTEPTTLLSFNLTTVTPTSVSDLMTSPSASMMSSLIVTTPSGPTTTRAPKPTTTPDPWAHLKCKNKLPLHAPDASFEVFVPGVLIYTCSPGFRQISGGAFIRCGASWGWTGPKGLIVCEQVIIEKPPPPDPVPEWLVPMVTAAAVLLGVLVLSILLVVLCVKRAPFLKRVRPWQPLPAEPATTKSGQGRRGWPWKRPWRTQRSTRPPPGHFGLDGVAWVVSDDNAIFPVKRMR